MKKFLFLLTGFLFMLASCSDGGSDSPDNPNPTPTPEDIASITCSTTSLSLGYEGGEKTLSFTVNKNWTISLASDISWCTISQTAGSAGTFNVSIKISENQEYDDRNVTIIIKCDNATHNVILTQKQKDALLITTNKYEIGQTGGTIEVEVKANIDYQVQIAETASSWIKETASCSLSSHKHSFAIAESEEYDKREGEIYFKSGNQVETVKVYQTGGAILVLSQNEYTVSDKGETISVEIKSNIEYGVQMPNENWITNVEASRAVSSHTLKYVVSANESYDSRSAEIIFYDKNSDIKDTLKVTQTKKNAIILSKREYTIPVCGGIFDVNVSTNIDFTIEISSNWIKQTTTSRGLENRQLYFEVDENTTEEFRVAFISFINGNIKQEIKIIQEGKDSVPYVTFTAEAEQTLTMSQSISTLEYSINGKNWKELGTNSVIFGDERGTLRLRGKSSMGTASSRSGYPLITSQIKFGNATPVACIGDIRTLIDYENYSTVNMSNARFCMLFSECTNLISAPELHSTTLASSCYSSMFEGCSNLTSAPKLPATTLAESCYNSMFEGCSSLTSAPELPAITLAKSCYSSMFEGCSNLTSAPKLPATTLAESCYSSMYKGCSSLTSAPELPAITLTKSCYSSMFEGCSSLISTPELPAKILSEWCYSGMFSGCSSLITAPTLPATTLAKYCYNGMFSKCISLSSAPELPVMTLASSCYSNMFKGCSSLTSAPELPAITLAEHCYSDMFASCCKLTYAPELPAKILSEWCYSGMFSGCSSLITAPTLPATTLAKYCYNGMFSKCISLSSAPELPVMTLTEHCYSGMFAFCTNLISTPELPATTLAPSCYGYMFRNCSNLKFASKLPATTLTKGCYSLMFSECNELNNITMLATDINATGCMYNWLKNVSSSGTFIKAKDMKDLPSGASGIPNGWTIVDYEE